MDGEIINKVTHKMKGGNIHVITEAVVMLKVVNKSIELGFQYMHLETDNTLVAKAIKDRDLPRTDWGMLCNQIRKNVVLSHW